MDEIVVDWLAVKWAEKQLGRPLTHEEIYGWKPVEVTTSEGFKAMLFIDKYHFSFFFPPSYER